MKVKVQLKKGNEIIGYSVFEYDQNDTYIYVGIGRKENKEFELVSIPFKEVVKIEAILYSNPRWRVKEDYNCFEI